MEVVVYDETEKFENYKHREFNYPFEQRKNNLALVEVDWDKSFDPEKVNEQYVFPTDEFSFRISQVCLDNEFMS